MTPKDPFEVFFAVFFDADAKTMDSNILYKSTVQMNFY